MYSIEDKNEAVKNVQAKLLDIEYAKDETKTLPIDGVYGTETAEAVLRFQHDNGLQETGKVDYETFVLLCGEAENVANVMAEQKETHNDPFPLRVTSQGVYVEILQNILNRLSEHYGDGTKTFHSGYFSDRTEDAVKFMQKKLHKPVTGTVSRDFMRELQKVLNTLEK